MRERLSPEQIETAKKGSQYSEKAWRVITFRGRHSPEEVEKAARYLVEQKKNIEACVDEVGGIDPDVYDRIFMGLYHHSVSLPPELKYKPTNLN